MPNTMKRHGFLPALPRRLTRVPHDAYGLVHFRDVETMQGDTPACIECPDHWSRESAELLIAEAGFNQSPLNAKVVEENTVPSWLWRHQARGMETTPETTARQIFNRVVGSATYAGWKNNLFADEGEARTFFDEMQYALVLRLIAIDPHALAGWGTDWAYGTSTSRMATAVPLSVVPPVDFAPITNSMIDAIVSGSAKKNLRAQWHQMLSGAPYKSVALRFADTTNDWGHNATAPVPVMIDLLTLRHNDGLVNIDNLRHTVRLIVTLFDLGFGTGTPQLAIGFCNLAPLLMALAIPYDSDAGRMTAASLAAIITAQATITSAQLAALRGPSADFTTRRDSIMRALRNHSRAVYDDHNDYEKISVIPQPLALTTGLDLTLAAAARALWDEALPLVRNHGLRAIHLTSSLTSPHLMMFMESVSQGTEAMASLIQTRLDDNDTATHVPHPCVTEALTRLGYSTGVSQSIIRHVVGHHTLEKAPVINHSALRDHGFDKVTLERVESYLPQVNNVHLAFTPWVVGTDFCERVLKLSRKQIENPAFDMLKHLGFKATDIMATNVFCYGHKTAKNAPGLQRSHSGIFASRPDLTPEARINMAAAVQSFVSSDVAITIELSSDTAAEKIEALVLSAWRQGLKILTLSYTEATIPAQATLRARHKRTTSLMHTRQPPKLPSRKAKSPSRVTRIGHAPGKSNSAFGQKSR